VQHRSWAPHHASAAAVSCCFLLSSSVLIAATPHTPVNRKLVTDRCSSHVIPRPRTCSAAGIPPQQQQHGIQADRCAALACRQADHRVGLLVFLKCKVCGSTCGAGSNWPSTRCQSWHDHFKTPTARGALAEKRHAMQHVQHTSTGRPLPLALPQSTDACYFKLSRNGPNVPATPTLFLL
jgi:hypothetical protein